MDRAPTDPLPGPSGLSIHATVALTIECTGNGRSTNGSSSDTPRRPRKRPRRPETWKRAVAKAKRARGEEYLSPSTGETVLARKTGPACSCRLKCFERFSQNEKAVTLRSFYKLGSKDLQDAHLFGLIHASAVKRRRPRDGVKNPRLATYTYMVRVVGRSEKVCQKAFASLYGVTVGRVRHIAKASATDVCAPKDRRGRHTSRPSVKSAGTKVQIKEHISSFPAMKSHYKSQRRKYLSPLLSVAEMHRLYVDKYEQGAEKPSVSYSYYAKMFNSEFNLGFGQPKTDTCPTCEKLKNELVLCDEIGQSVVKKAKKDHLNSAEQFYSSLRLNTRVAKQDDAVLTLTFDFQQNFPLPHIPVSDMFYMQQLWMYVFGIHSCSDNQVKMYCWPENVAKRGSDEVVSCLHHFLSRVPPSVTTLFLYSDGCPGQNKNSNVMHYLHSLVLTGKFVKITHVFPVRGHSFLPNDRDFGRTEIRKRKYERVYTCEQWMDVIRKARVRKPFEVVACDNTMFLEWSSHFSQFFKKIVKDHAKKPLTTSKARVLEYSNTHFTEVWVKYEPCGEWNKYSTPKRNATPSLPQPATAQKYTEAVPLKEKKLADLKKIIRKYVPTEYKDYYEPILRTNVDSESLSHDGD